MDYYKLNIQLNSCKSVTLWHHLYFPLVPLPPPSQRGLYRESSCGRYISCSPSRPATTSCRKTPWHTRPPHRGKTLPCPSPRLGDLNLAALQENCKRVWVEEFDEGDGFLSIETALLSLIDFREQISGLEAKKLFGYYATFDLCKNFYINHRLGIVGVFAIIRHNDLNLHIYLNLYIQLLFYLKEPLGSLFW